MGQPVSRPDQRISGTHGCEGNPSAVPGGAEFNLLAMAGGGIRGLLLAWAAVFDRRRREFGDESEAALMHRADDRLILAAIADRMPRGADPAAERRVGDDTPAPIRSSLETTRSRFSMRNFSTSKTWGSTETSSPPRASRNLVGSSS